MGFHDDSPRKGVILSAVDIRKPPVLVYNRLSSPRGSPLIALASSAFLQYLRAPLGLL